MSNSETIVITGASAGVGRATARAFARKGTRIGLLARGRDGLEGAQKEVVSAGGDALVLPVDVASPEQPEAAAASVEENLGPDRCVGQCDGIRPFSGHTNDG